MLVNREIKFRAWDKKKKQMIGHDHLFRIDCSNEYPFLALLQNMYDYDLDVEIMQYTGLKDKNGIEIYEGDLFKGWNGVYVVAWLPFDAGLYLVQYGEWNDYLDGKDSPVDVYTLNSKRYEFISQIGAGEVIGNCFEHPHLLKEAESNANA